MEKLNKIEYDLIERLTHRYGLPLHVLFIPRLEQNAKQFKEVTERLYPNSLIAFAVKSNSCRGAIQAANRLSLGIDVVSEYELQAALEEGIQTEMIICNGNAKSDRYLEMCVSAGTLIAADCSQELDIIDNLADRLKTRARVMLRFSGMPLEGLTSADQSTASLWTKFGFAYYDADDVFDFARKLRKVDVVGLSAHIGTQICDASGYDRLFSHLFSLIRKASQRNLNTRYIDIGGGYPISYMSRESWEGFQRRLRDQLAGRLPASEWVTWDNLPLGYCYLKDRPPGDEDHWSGKAYWSEFPAAGMLERVLNHKIDSETIVEKLHNIGSPTLIIEPGRALFGSAGITIARVSNVKQVQGNTVVALELGINSHGTNLITPDIFPVTVFPSRDDDSPVEVFLAGQLCFTGDMISKVKVMINRIPERGELVVIHHTGAYCADHFASNSCGFPRPAKVAIRSDGKVELWRNADRFEGVFSPVTISDMKGE